METLIYFGIPAVLLIVVLIKGIKIVPQSDNYVIEQFGKYTKTLTAGLNIIVPFLDAVRHKVSIIERQLGEVTISVITQDNVEVKLEAAVFYRIEDAARSVYRIEDVDRAIKTASESIVRSAGGKLDLDGLQSSREQLAEEILGKLGEAAEEWGIKITRSEITDVIIDEQTKEAQRQQLNAERERRAAVTRAEGDKKAAELNAEAQLYEAQKQAEAVKVQADAVAHQTRVEGEAKAFAIKVQAEALKDNNEMIDLEKARAWDGKLPTTNVAGDSGANFLFELKMVEYLAQYNITMPMTFFAVGLIAIILDALLIGEATLLSIGIGAIITAGVIGVFGVENIYIMLLIFAAWSLISVIIMKTLIIKKQPREDINEY